MSAAQLDQEQPSTIKDSLNLSAFISYFNTVQPLVLALSNRQPVVNAKASPQPVSSQLSLSIRDVQRATSLSRASVYRKIAEGQLHARKVGARTVILRSDLELFLASLPKLGG